MGVVENNEAMKDEERGEEEDDEGDEEEKGRGVVQSVFRTHTIVRLGRNEQQRQRRQQQRC